MFGNRDDFMSVGYFTSMEGILKILGIALLIMSTVIHILYSTCENLYPLLFPIGTGTSSVLCACFYLGHICSRSNAKLNAVDMICTTVCLIVVIAVSALSLVNCSELLNLIFASVALIGALCFAISASASLIKNRTDRYPAMEEHSRHIPQHNTLSGMSAAQYRKSIMI